YFVSFMFLLTPGSSAMGRFPRRPALLLFHLRQGGTLQPRHTPETDGRSRRRPLGQDGPHGLTSAANEPPWRPAPAGRHAEKSRGAFGQKTQMHHFYRVYGP